MTEVLETRSLTDSQIETYVKKELTPYSYAEASLDFFPRTVEDWTCIIASMERFKKIELTKLSAYAEMLVKLASIEKIEKEELETVIGNIKSRYDRIDEIDRKIQSAKQTLQYAHER